MERVVCESLIKTSQKEPADIANRASNPENSNSNLENEKQDSQRMLFSNDIAVSTCGQARMDDGKPFVCYDESEYLKILGISNHDQDDISDNTPRVSVEARFWTSF
jgi:hypothetical protein